VAVSATTLRVVLHGTVMMMRACAAVQVASLIVPCRSWTSKRLTAVHQQQPQGKYGRLDDGVRVAAVQVGLA